MKQIYLASRYDRRLELCHYRTDLIGLGYLVQARWLDGAHQALVAVENWEDVTAADVVIAFTEPPRASASHGVELGIALGMLKRVIVVGWRENVFCWLPQVEFHRDWISAYSSLGKTTL